MPRRRDIWRVSAWWLSVKVLEHKLSLEMNVKPEGHPLIQLLQTR